MTYTVAVEAKGRSNGWTAGVTNKAKLQAKSLPTVVHTTSALSVASVSYFGEAASWEAYLEDPPATSTYSVLDEQLTTSILLISYYRPLVAAITSEGTREDEAIGDSQTYVARLPAVDLWLGLPRAIVELLRPIRLGVLTDDQTSALGADLLAEASGLAL